jgi:hypothetical protein
LKPEQAALLHKAESSLKADLIKAQEARILGDCGVEFEDAEAMAAVQIERAARFVASARALLEE